ncbi:MAG: NAD(P)/FAD-dependent oxidoreductase [Acidimicrobiia bacterium]
MSGERVAVVGGGMLGSVVALRLARAGREVTLYEAAPALGGLASAWRLGDVHWDRHYHVTLLSDSYLRAVLDELGLDSEIRWVETRTGSLFAGKVHSVSNTLEFLRFPPLSLIDKARLGFTIFYGSRVRNWQRLDVTRVEDWLVRWSGRKVFNRFWLPLLQSKLGDEYRATSAAFIWATIQRLYAARRTGLKKELFGYVPGGYARILERLGAALTAAGVDVRLGTAVKTITTRREVQTEMGSETFDRVVVTTPSPLAGRLIEGLSESEAKAFARRYQGIVCVSILTRRPLQGFYVTYLHDPAPFTAVIEMSALVDPSQFGGRSLLYLPKYLPSDSPLFDRPDEEFAAEFLAALEKIYPEFDRSDVEAIKISRARQVFALSTLGYAQTVPPFDTSIERIHLISSAQIVNGTLNVNETIKLAEAGVEHLLGAQQVPERLPSPGVAGT